MKVDDGLKTSSEMEAQLPFKASWINGFNSWVKGLAVPAGLFFVMVGLLLVVVQLLFLVLEGGLQDAALLPVVGFNGLFIAFLLALIYLLDHQAINALQVMQPVLDVRESAFEQVQYRLSNMPFRPSLLAGLATVVFVLLMERLSGAPLRYAALGDLPLFAIVFQVIDKVSAFLFGAFIYHTIRQLRLVNGILNEARINLFNLGPLQAFSRLTASTAVGLMVGVYGWIVINPELLSDPLILVFVGLITLLATAVFVWPLLGVHKRMEMAKGAKLQALDSNLEAVFLAFNQALDDGDGAAMERLNGTIASLDIQRKTIAQIPTWPWHPETAQFVFAAIALPLVLAVLQFLVEQALQ